MKLKDRIKVEQAVSSARGGILRELNYFIAATKEILTEGEQAAAVAGILALDGISAPEAERLRIEGPTAPISVTGIKQRPGLWPATEGFDASAETELEDADLAELEEMVAAPEAPTAGLLYGKPATAEDLAMAELQAKAPPGAQGELPPQMRVPSPLAEHVTPEPELKSRPLDDDERARVLDLAVAGIPASIIADDLGRSRRGFHLVVKNLLAAADAEQSDDADATEAGEPEDEEPEPSEQPTPEPVTSLGFTCDPPPGAPLRVKELHRFLDRLGYPDPWTPTQDAILATMLANGEGLVNTVTALKLDRTQVKARWEALLPVKGIDEQARLVAALQERKAIWDLRRDRGAQAAQAAE